MKTKPKWIRTVVYLFCCSTALMVAIGQKKGIIFPWFIQNYWNDLMVMPLVLKLALIVLQKIHGKDWVLSIGHIFLCCAYFAFLFELVFPYYYERYTSDIWDVVAYFVGGILYYCIEYDTYKMP